MVLVIYTSGLLGQRSTTRQSCFAQYELQCKGLNCCLVSDEERVAMLGLRGADSELRLMDIQPL